MSQEKAKEIQNQKLSVSENKENKEIVKKSTYKIVRLEGIKITSKQATKKANHYQVN
ncbi:MAG: hypothetical protein NY202_02825 [Mollicutes bacterium UO1]